MPPESVRPPTTSMFGFKMRAQSPVVLCPLCAERLPPVADAINSHLDSHRPTDPPTFKAWFVYRWRKLWHR